MIKAVDASLIAKRANDLSCNDTFRMLYQKIYSAAACGHDRVAVLFEVNEFNHIEEALREYGYTTNIVSGFPSGGYIMLNIEWKF